MVKEDMQLEMGRLTLWKEGEEMLARGQRYKVTSIISVQN